MGSAAPVRERTPRRQKLPSGVEFWKRVPFSSNPHGSVVVALTVFAAPTATSVNRDLRALGKEVFYALYVQVRVQGSRRHVSELSWRSVVQL